ncbi:MAG TPA: glycosyltransferase family 4 protein [Ktedonobacteraceae bacterium]|nr:glycosyltransferase family 4 protein [Ktedonobacteraceae bacterium]
MRKNRKVLKILMIVENMSVPADPRVWREAQTLHQFGFQVCIICPRGEQCDQALYECLSGIHIYRYPPCTATGKASDYIKEFAIAVFQTFILSLKIWQKHGFDIMHAANPPDLFFLLGLFYRPLGKKFIFDQHDLSPEVFRVRFHGRMRPLYTLMKLLERCSYRTAHVVITTNESHKRMATQRGHCSPDKVVVVRNGPELSKFHIPPAEAALKQGKRYLLAYIGVMGAQDGVEYTLHALHRLVYERGRQDVALVLMGNGDQLHYLKEAVNELRLHEYVKFTGWLTKKDMLSYLSVADIGLSPDPSNVLNDTCTMLKTMEYMAMSKPVVAFDLPETRYSAQEAALYATPNSVEDFTNKIELLLEHADLRRQLGAFGRQRIEKELCWERTKMQLLHAYQKLFPTSMPQEHPTCSSADKNEQQKIPVSQGVE